MNDPKPQVVIPWSLGTVAFKNAAAQRQVAGNLGPGRYMVSSRTLVPFVKIDFGMGECVLSWGEIIEIPQGQSGGQIYNASYHAGDIYFQGIGTGAGAASLRPGAITIPAVITKITGSNDFITSKIDTRLAKRVYFWRDGTGQDMLVTVTLGSDRGFNAAPQSNAATSKQGNPTYNAQIITYSNNVAIGFGANQVREPAPGLNTLPELRAMALLDWAQLSWTAADAAAAGIDEFQDGFFTVEY